jgi:hypothetical protein
VELQTVFGSINQSAPVEVRTLPEDPQRFALSWGQDAIASGGWRRFSSWWSASGWAGSS